MKKLAISRTGPFLWVICLSGLASLIPGVLHFFYPLRALFLSLLVTPLMEPFAAAGQLYTYYIEGKSLYTVYATTNVHTTLSPEAQAGVLAASLGSLIEWLACLLVWITLAMTFFCKVRSHRRILWEYILVSAGILVVIISQLTIGWGVGGLIMWAFSLA